MNLENETQDIQIADVQRMVELWLSDNWDESLTVREWWRRLADAGFSEPGWPEGCGGRSYSRVETRAVISTLAAAGVVAPPTGGVGAHLTGPTLLRHGTPEQVRQFLPSIADGTASWCQLFSEPGAGSDLASASARAELDGDEWVVSGQKVWNSSADIAHYGLLLARTDFSAPKHQGLTYFLIDMDQPGIDVRPLRQMNGTTSFCEVFLTEARTPADWVLGERNAGWSVAQTTLMAERSNIAELRTAAGLIPVASGMRAGNLDRTVGEVMAEAADADRSPITGGALPVSMMIELARTHGADRDPVIRQRIAEYHTHVTLSRWTNSRIAASKGRLTGADGQLAKLAIAAICQESRDLSFSIIGARTLLADDDAPFEGALQRVGLSSPGTRIGGGTDEVQRNVIGERGLGLPREPGPSKETPFSEPDRNQ